MGKDKLEFKNGSTIESLDCEENQRSKRGKESLLKQIEYYKYHPYRFYRDFSYRNSLRFHQKLILDLIYLREWINRKFNTLFIKAYFKLIKIILYGFKNKKR